MTSACDTLKKDLFPNDIQVKNLFLIILFLVSTNLSNLVYVNEPDFILYKYCYIFF
jgi:hypothetical protein